MATVQAIPARETSSIWAIVRLESGDTLKPTERHYNAIVSKFTGP